ncbi:MAG: hypothetical protein Q8P23_01290 [bacterium]|nr:hypothetical protein [bacterium]
MKYHVKAYIEFDIDLDPNTDGPLLDVFTGKKPLDSLGVWAILDDIVDAGVWKNLDVKGRCDPA